MTTLALLRAGRRRVKKGWCQSRAAETISGISVAASSPLAVKWCATGAVRGVSDSEAMAAIAILYCDRVVQARVGGCCVTCYNDTRGRRKIDILRVYDKAIALAKKEAAA